MYLVYLVFLVCFSRDGKDRKSISSIYRQNHHRYHKEQEIAMHIVYDVIFEDKHMAQAHGVTWLVHYWCLFLSFLESVWSSRSKVLPISVIKASVSVFSQGQEKPIERCKSKNVFQKHLFDLGLGQYTIHIEAVPYKQVRWKSWKLSHIYPAATQTWTTVITYRRKWIELQVKSL